MPVRMLRISLLVLALAHGAALAQNPPAESPQATQKPPVTQVEPIPQRPAEEAQPGMRVPAFPPPPPEQAALPGFEALEAAGAVIGRIVISPQQIFDLDDPRESGWFYRLANRLHVKTRPEVIERQLLFKTGDYVSTRVIN